MRHKMYTVLLPAINTRAQIGGHAASIMLQLRLKQRSTPFNNSHVTRTRAQNLRRLRALSSSGWRVENIEPPPAVFVPRFPPHAHRSSAACPDTPDRPSQYEAGSCPTS